MTIKNTFQIMSGYTYTLICKTEVRLLSIHPQGNLDMSSRVRIPAGIVAQNKQQLSKPLFVSAHPHWLGWGIQRNRNRVFLSHHLKILDSAGHEFRQVHAIPFKLEVGGFSTG